MRLLPIVCLVALIAACADPTEPAGKVEITVHPAEVVAGDEVTVTVENRSSSSIMPAWCGPIPLQRANGEGWSPFRWHAGPEQRFVCIAMGLLIPPGGRYAVPVQLAEDLPPGLYRMRLDISVPGRQVEDIPSSGFTVQPREQEGE